MYELVSHYKQYCFAPNFRDLPFRLSRDRHSYCARIGRDVLPGISVPSTFDARELAKSYRALVGLR